MATKKTKTAPAKKKTVSKPAPKAKVSKPVKAAAKPAPKTKVAPKSKAPAKAAAKAPVKPVRAIEEPERAPAVSVLTPRKLEKYRKMLVEEFQRLLTEAHSTMEDLQKDDEEVSFPDITDRASVESDRNFLLRIRDRERKLIGKVKEALGRLDEGGYGLCESCGQPIEEKRLEARPITTLCIECKNDQESEEKRQRN